MYRGRVDFDDQLRPLQTHLAIALCGVALFLALPILDFGAISARSQIARLESGKVTAEAFDWTAMAFDFGPKGREQLTRMSKTGPTAQRQLAGLALKAEDRWNLRQETEIAENKVNIEKRVRLLSPDIQWDDDLKRRVSERGDCGEQTRCALVRVTPDRLMLLKSIGAERYLSGSLIDLTELPSKTRAKFDSMIVVETPPAKDDLKGIDLDKAEVEVRQETVQQVYVDGKPVGFAVRISR